jgi:hypothetical protein
MSSEYWLAHGAHATPDDGRCAMEWVSYLAGEPHSDQPACVSPALRAFCVSLNDNLAGERRQRLRPYLTRTIGTAQDGLDGARGWMAADWLIRVYTPAWLELAGAGEAAWQLALLAPLREASDLPRSLDALMQARRDARAALKHVLRASRVARLVPSATGRWARKAAWASGEAAVWTVARVGVGGVVGEQVRDDATAAAGDAAAAAARAAAAQTGGGGRRDAARAALAPTVRALERSSVALLDRMLPTQPLSELPRAIVPA